MTLIGPALLVIGTFVGGFVGIGLLSRLARWLLKRLGDNLDRVFAAQGLALATATVIGGYGFAAPAGTPQFLQAFETYLIPCVAWLAIDILALRGRKATREVKDIDAFK